MLDLPAGLHHLVIHKVVPAQWFDGPGTRSLNILQPEHTVVAHFSVKVCLPLRAGLPR